MPICTKSILKCVLLISLFWTGCALFKNENAPPDIGVRNENGSVFSKAQTLVMARDYENALPFIKRSLEADNPNYYDSLLLAARAYDQIAQPEKALLALQEYLKPQWPPKELTARSLLLKNQAKVKIDISKSAEKKIIQQLVKKFSQKQALEALNWSLDFQCDQYCLEEVAYLQEIQLILLYLVEEDTETSVLAADMIRNRYDFFQNYLKSETFSNDFKKSLAHKLYASLQKLRALDLTYIEKNHRYPSKTLLISLKPLEKNLESWLYK